MSEDLPVDIQSQVINYDSFAEILQKYKYANLLVDTITGNVLEVSHPSGLHGETAILLSTRIANFVYGNRLGRVTGMGTGFLLKQYGSNEKTAFTLDIAFIHRDKAPKPLHNQLVEVIPDLAVEIISSADSACVLQTKCASLLEAGTQAVWVVYPNSQTVVVHRGNHSKLLRIDDMLTGDDALPGLELPVREIFAE